MSPSELDEELHRAAMAELDQLLDQSGAERSARLATLAGTQPRLHALLVDLLEHAAAAAKGFMEPAASARPQYGLRADARLGPYRIIRLLGEGGMGEVWLASRDDGLYEGQVAIKTLHPYFAGGALRERFLREARVLGRLAHPGIARILDAGIHDGAVYIVLEYVVGRPIDAACDERRLDIGARLVIFQQLCAAVAHAHSSLVVHRDIKPGNVLLTAEGAPKLLDFGISSFFEEGKPGESSELTRLTGRVFTPQYAAPEQVSGQEVTTATDVYSLGVLLYVLLSGRLPYGAVEAARVQWEHAVLHLEPQRMARTLEQGDHVALAANRSTSSHRLQRELSGELESIVQKALRKNPADRYPTVAALADDIRRYMSGEPVLARPDSGWYRLAKFTRRNRLAAGAVAASMVALGVGLAVSLWQLQVARSERQHAEEVTEFVRSIFSSADPNLTGTTQTTAIELLSMAHERIESELKEKPQIAVELLNIVGGTQLQLDQIEASRVTLEKSMQIAERMQPGDPVRLAEARALAAWAQNSKGDFQGPRKLLEKALPVLRENFPDTQRSYAIALEKMASIEYDEGNRALAVAQMREVARIENALVGPRHTDTIVATSNLAYYLIEEKQYEEARSILERLLADARAMASSRTGLVNLSQVEAMYGRLLVDSGELDAGIAQLTSSIEHADQIFGARGNRSVSASLTALMRAHARNGDLKAAIAIAERTYTVGEEGIVAARVLVNVGRYTLLGRQVEKSLEPLEQAIAQSKKYDTGKGSWLPLAQSDYGVALALSGRMVEAEKLLRENLPLAKETAMFGALPDAWNAIGFLRQLQSRWPESEAAFREGLKYTSDTDISPKFRADAMLGIGMARLEAGEAVVAEDWLRKADAAAHRTYLRLTPQRADIAMHLGRALLAQKKLEAARESIAAADAYWQNYDAANRSAGEVAYWLAQVHRAAGSEAEARQALTRAVAVLDKSPLAAQAALVKDARQLLVGLARR